MNLPTLSIGMPVYNSERYIAETLESLLAQTFKDFEIIISDNCSTDKTADICDRYVRMDRRIRYTRQSRNRGGPFNWNWVARQARGIFFKWASSNDLYDPHFLEECISELRARPDVVLCYTNTILIDDDGVQLSVYRDPIDLSDDDPIVRFAKYLLDFRLTMNNAQAGIIRTEVLRRTGLEGNYPHGDIPLMAELALRGKYFRVSRPLFWRRMSPGAATPKKSEMAITQFVSPNATKPSFWRWPQCIDILRASIRGPGGFSMRLRAVSFVLRWMNWRRNELKDDLRAYFRSRIISG